MEGALDYSIANVQDAERSDIRGHAENLVTVSNYAPSERSDGTPNQYGDFWFSPHTNIMYIWFNMEWVLQVLMVSLLCLCYLICRTGTRESPGARVQTSLTVIVSLEVPRRMPGSVALSVVPVVLTYHW